jgi:hypothetical protein
MTQSAQVTASAITGQRPHDGPVMAVFLRTMARFPSTVARFPQTMALFPENGGPLPDCPRPLQETGAFGCDASHWMRRIAPAPLRLGRRPFHQAARPAIIC